MKTLIAIPARWGSTRFPGKPLALLAGRSLLSHMIEVARMAAKQYPNVQVMVVTDDDRIFRHAEELDVRAAMTPSDCRTGSDRVFAGCAALPSEERPHCVINLQGDAPLTAPQHLEALIEAFLKNPQLEAATVAVRLTWETLDALRSSKKTTPFSGTTVTVNTQGRALWFSKNILPAIRKERRNEPYSPVLKHIGLYGYTLPFLSEFIHWEEGVYEQIEGLEQLRILEKGRPIHVIEVKGSGEELGVDTPEDLQRAEAILAERP